MIRLDNISKQHGPQVLFVDASAAIQRGERIGLVGPNGAGKSTVFRLIVGEESADEGQIAIDRNVTMGHFSQDVGEMRGMTAIAATMDGAGPVSELAREMRELEDAMADPGRAADLDGLVDRFGHVQARFDELGGYALEARAREIMTGLGFSQEMMDGEVGNLSGGWKMRVALARILLMRPNVLLLDEPSNHLDIESIIWLESFLRAHDGALLMTTHDREFMNRVVGKIIEIDGGVLTTYSGNYDFYEKQRALTETQAEAAYQRQQAMMAKEIRFIERFKAQASHAAQVQSRVKKLDKIEKLEPPRRRKTLTFEFPQAPRSGEDVVKLAGVSKGYGTRAIYQGLDLMIRRGERWAVMGVNGAGKSTLLKLVAGEIAPDTGTVTLGAGVRLGYFAQHAMELLDPDQTVYETFEEAFPLASIGTLKSLGGCFGFSGGEKARVVMARLLFARPNLLVLDEPTNHLDLATKEMLLTSLKDFEGTMLFVSHDRRFLGALSNRVLELVPGAINTYGGGYLEYVARSGHEAPGLRA
ncbi:MAG: ABC-F family ATP-binding cassette domain-containing protein [Polyangia bacterium]